MIEHCPDAFSVSIVCGLLKSSPRSITNGGTGKPSRLQQGNARLLRKIRHLYHESVGVFGRPRTWEELCYEGETCSLNRAARLVQSKAGVGIPSRKQCSK